MSGFRSIKPASDLLVIDQRLLRPLRPHLPPDLQGPEVHPSILVVGAPPCCPSSAGPGCKSTAPRRTTCQTAGQLSNVHSFPRSAREVHVANLSASVSNSVSILLNIKSPHLCTVEEPPCPEQEVDSTELELLPPALLYADTF